MFNRTAEYFAHGSRSLNPILHKLRPDQRIRLEKSSKKVGQVLGEMPVIDVVPASPRAGDVPVMIVDEKRDKKGRKEKAKAKAPAAPVLRYKLAPTARPSTPVPSTGMLEVSIVRPRKAAPYSLDLATPLWQLETGPRSPFNYNRYVRQPRRQGRRKLTTTDTGPVS